MAAPSTKEEALRQMRFIWFGYIVSIMLYVWMGETIPGLSWLNFPRAGETFVILGVLDLIYFSWSKWKRYSPALEGMQRHPENIRTVGRWMNSWVVLICIAQSEALFGLAFRMGDETLQRSLPFYVVGFLLTLWLWPRQVWSSTSNAAQ